MRTSSAKERILTTLIIILDAIDLHVYLVLTNLYIEPPNYRFLLKASSLTLSINALLLFAQSPHGRTRSLRGTNLDINVAPNNSREIKLPPNVEYLKAVANSALESRDTRTKVMIQALADSWVGFSRKVDSSRKAYGGKRTSSSMHPFIVNAHLSCTF